MASPTVKKATEVAVAAALKRLKEPLTTERVRAICEEVVCSPATFYRTKAYRGLKQGRASPCVTGTERTMETMTNLRATISLLANCVRALALRVENQDRELHDLRSRVHDNVTPFRKPGHR